MTYKSLSNYLQYSLKNKIKSTKILNSLNNKDLNILASYSLANTANNNHKQSKVLKNRRIKITMIKIRLDR